MTNAGASIIRGLKQARLDAALRSLQRRYSLRFFLRSGVSQLALSTGTVWHDLQDDGE